MPLILFIRFFPFAFFQLLAFPYYSFKRKEKMSINIVYCDIKSAYSKESLDLIKILMVLHGSTFLFKDFILWCGFTYLLRVKNI